MHIRVLLVQKTLIFSNEFQILEAECDAAEVQRIVDEGMRQLQPTYLQPKITLVVNQHRIVVDKRVLHDYVTSHCNNFEDVVRFLSENTNNFVWISAALSFLLYTHQDSIIRACSPLVDLFNGFLANI